MIRFLDQDFVDDSPAFDWNILKPKNLFESGYLSDFTIVIGQHQFPAHKIILMLKSPVFEVMLNINMQEKNNNQLELEDLQAESFKS